VSSPFDNRNAQFVVLVNDERKFSLWPEHIDLPPGWTLAYGPEVREQCLKFVDKSWTDMQPRDLVGQDGNR
jgi:MbtH protein